MAGLRAELKRARWVSSSVCGEEWSSHKSAGAGVSPAVRTDLNQREKCHTNNRAHKTAPAASSALMCSRQPRQRWMRLCSRNGRVCVSVRDKHTSDIYSHLCPVNTVSDDDLSMKSRNQKSAVIKGRPMYRFCRLIGTIVDCWNYQQKSMPIVFQVALRRSAVIIRC